MRLVEQGTIPELWVGAKVVVGLLQPGGILRIGGKDSGYRLPAAVYKRGVLEAVNEHGIVGEFQDVEKDEPTMRVFYPWSAVLALTPIE